jgi:ABC-type multidrug transport system fused ATPase/permease subunit
MREQQEILGAIGTNIQQNILGMKVVRCFQGEGRAVESYKAIEEKYVRNGILSGKLQAENLPLGFFILTIVTAAAYVYGAETVQGRARQVGNFQTLTGNPSFIEAYLKQVEMTGRVLEKATEATRGK